MRAEINPGLISAGWRNQSGIDFRGLEKSIRD
jgi:hypothetical protein